MCGDGVVQDGEVCDVGGESPVCDVDCTEAECGDGVLNASSGEGCDGGGESVSCNKDCTLQECGDAKLNATAGEVCDDGNLLGGDACSQACWPTKLLDLEVGRAHSCVVFESGAVRCWGNNSDGQLGYGDVVSLGDDPGELPADDVNVGAKVVQVALGDYHTCARTDSGKVRCWGLGSSGQLGYGNNASLGYSRGQMPPADVDLGSPATQISAGGMHTCALLETGTVRCWGDGTWGQLGYETSTSVNAPFKTDVPGVSSVMQIAAGGRHTCALRKNGKVLCWGYNGQGQLGLGHIMAIGDEPGEMPPAEVALDDVGVLSAGIDHTCAGRMFGGGVYCWGRNNAGKLGSFNGDVGDEPGEMPPPAVNLGGAFLKIVAGDDQTCALLYNKKVRCWGYYQAAGYPGPKDIGFPEDFPPQDLDLGGDAVDLASHLGEFNCALLVDGTLRCWGENFSGQLGYGHKEVIGDDETPADAGGVQF